MRNIVYTFAQVQSSVLVIDWQGIAPHGLFAAASSPHSVKWPNLFESLPYPITG